MKPKMGHLALGLLGMGFPLTQIVIRRFGKAGAMAVEAMSIGVLARDVALVAGGAPRTMRRAPAVLLWLETAAAAVASVLGLRLVLSDEARLRALDQHPVGPEIARRIAVGTMFGMGSWRLRIAQQPTSQLRPDA